MTVDATVIKGVDKPPPFARPVSTSYGANRLFGEF